MRACLHLQLVDGAVVASERALTSYVGNFVRGQLADARAQIEEYSERCAPPGMPHVCACVAMEVEMRRRHGKGRGRQVEAPCATTLHRLPQGQACLPDPAGRRHLPLLSCRPGRRSSRCAIPLPHRQQPRFHTTITARCCRSDPTRRYLGAMTSALEASHRGADHRAAALAQVEGYVSRLEALMASARELQRAAERDMPALHDVEAYEEVDESDSHPPDEHEEEGDGAKPAEEGPEQQQQQQMRQALDELQLLGDEVPIMQQRQQQQHEAAAAEEEQAAVAAQQPAPQAEAEDVPMASSGEAAAAEDGAAAGPPHEAQGAGQEVVQGEAAGRGMQGTVGGSYHVLDMAALEQQQQQEREQEEQQQQAAAVAAESQPEAALAVAAEALAGAVSGGSSSAVDLEQLQLQLEGCASSGTVPPGQGEQQEEEEVAEEPHISYAGEEGRKMWAGSARMPTVQVPPPVCK